MGFAMLGLGASAGLPSSERGSRSFQRLKASIISRNIAYPGIVGSGYLSGSDLHNSKLVAGMTLK
jgi:hypothetical protein